LRIGKARCTSSSANTTCRSSRAGGRLVSAGGGAGRTNTSAALQSRWAISRLRWQAAQCKGRSVPASGGSTVRQTSTAIGQRGRNGQPEGRLTSDGGVPSIGISGSFSSTSIRGMEPSSPIVYGIRGA
jgi:hypothetical protein